MAIGLALGGIKPANVFEDHEVNSIAMAPPPRESNSPSKVICRISCMRLAPSDCRMAISRLLETKRTSISVATLAQVSSSTTPAMASRMGSDEAR